LISVARPAWTATVARAFIEPRRPAWHDGDATVEGVFCEVTEQKAMKGWKQYIEPFAVKGVFEAFEKL
jgi:hypothetical protein